MQAARALAGYTLDQLASAIDEPGLGERSLRNIEGGTPVPRSRQRAIVEACGVPSAFIDADLWLLEACYDALTDIPREVRDQHGDDVLVTRAFRLLSEQPDYATLNDRIARLEHQLAVLTQTEAAGDPPHLGEHFRGDGDAVSPPQVPGQTQTPGRESS